MLINISVKCSIVDLISLSFNNFFKIMNYFLFEIDENNKENFYFKLFFYFEFDDDLKYRITFSMFLLNFLIKTHKKSLFIIQFENQKNF